MYSRGLLAPPGIPRGAYHEREELQTGTLERLLERTRLAFSGLRANPIFSRGLIRSIEREEKTLERTSDAEIADAARELRESFHAEGIRPASLARSFALVRTVAERTIKQRHYDVQLIGGWVLLQGKVAEMETGEGKTLTATLAASTAALAGVPVHVITVNDYLAERDALWMGPIYRALGLRVGLIVHGMDHAARRRAYQADVVYLTNKEIAFDYLRDRITLGGSPGRLHVKLDALSGAGSRSSRLLLRGLHYAIVDEADSVFADEGRTPLVISSSESPEESRRVYQGALDLAERLHAGRHFDLDRKDRRVQLTGAGRGLLEELGRSRGGLWMRRRMREELVLQALTAKYLFLRDQHYLVKDDRIQIIDEYTGRSMPDRSWEHGLHQLVEIKEGCALTPESRPVARISYQRFFRRYMRLAGMTGTAREIASELGGVYGLGVVRVRPNRPLKRVRYAARVFFTRDEKWQAVVARIKEIHETGRPILVGTRSVEASEHLSRLLDEARLSHQVLNARQDREEAEIVASAGQHGRITVATNMAGRGTDILLDESVIPLGGLHVIATERHDSRRIDRQLSGRSGRQGDPGSHEALISLEDDLIVTHGGAFAKRLMDREHEPGKPLSPWLGELLFRSAQRRAERKSSRVRRELLLMDQYLDTSLAFAGGRD